MSLRPYPLGPALSDRTPQPSEGRRMTPPPPPVLPRPGDLVTVTDPAGDTRPGTVIGPSTRLQEQGAIAVRLSPGHVHHTTQWRSTNGG